MAKSTAGVITISRGASLQDFVRRYTVFIDDESIGHLWSMQTGSYAVEPGLRRVQLKIEKTGSSVSAVVEVDVEPRETRALRVGRHSAREYAEAPLGIVQPERYAPRPWIVLELLERS